MIAIPGTNTVTSTMNTVIALNEEEFSTSSTIAVDDTNLAVEKEGARLVSESSLSLLASHHTVFNIPSRLRTVDFDESATVWYDATHILLEGPREASSPAENDAFLGENWDEAATCDDEEGADIRMIPIRALWYSPREYRVLRRSALKLAERLRQQDASSRQQRTSYHRIVSWTLEVCQQLSCDLEGSVLSRRETKVLQQATREDLLRMGLDKWTLPTVGMDRKTRPALLVQRVVEAQDRTRGDEEELRKISQSISRPNRLFARQMAQARFGE